VSRLILARRTLVAIAAILAVWHSPSASAQDAAAEAETNFTQLCGACHSIGGGRRVGPDLLGVNERRTPEWLLAFVTSPQTVIQSGDPTATALLREFNNVVMPDAPLTPVQITEILAYIGRQTGVAPPAAVRPATPEEIERGQQLFQGTTRFANGGPACNSCHHVTHDAVIGGGVLAKDLTSVFSRMGGPGIQSVLGTPPFPVMEQAYSERHLTPEEVGALVGFLQDADQHQALQTPRDFGFRLFYSGLAGLVPLMGLYALIWRRRKMRAVNHDIFARQLRTRGEGES